MILVMANQYIKTSHSARNETIILAQIILIIFAAIISLIMSIIDKNKTLTIALLVMYLLSGGLFLIFKNAGRI